MRYTSALMAMGCILAIMTMTLFSNYAYAYNPGQLEIKMVPGKITEDNEGLIQVYSKSGGSIDKLIATSYDQSIVQVVGIDQDNSHSVYAVKIKTGQAGETKIAFAAPGFSSEEFTINVSKNSNIATKLLIKTTPSTFNTNGPTHGYFSVEATNEGDFPTAVTSDMPITITASDMNVMSLKEGHVVIKKGAYYAVGEFDIKQPGSVQISASSPSMQTVSSSIVVNNINSQNTVQVYVYPQKINAFKASYVYAIIQLHDSSGNPILAKEDIPITIQVTNSTSTAHINTSGDSPYVQVNEKPVIKKGSYWAYVPVELTAGSSSTFNVAISAKGYLVSPPAQFTSVMDTTVFDDNSAKIDPLPVLATGGKELIGIVHLEDSDGNTLLAKDNLSIHVDSSNLSVLSIHDISFDHGSQAAPVFAQVGDVVNPVTLNVVTATPQTITPTVVSSNAESMTLVAEPLIPKILSHVSFPLAFYMTKDGTISYPTSDFNVQIAPDNMLQTQALSFAKNLPIHVTNATLLMDGSQVFSLTGSTYSTTFTLKGSSSYPKSITMDFPDTILSNTPNMFSVELLDDQSLPVYADPDIAVKLVSSDPSVMDMPDGVQIKKGAYYTTFGVQAKKSGDAEITILADQIPLSKFKISVISFTPEVSIQSPDYSELHYPLVATVTAAYKQMPLAGLKVEWKTNGTTIQNMDSVTNSEGKAKITVIASDPGHVHIEATVSGGSYETVTATKVVQVNTPLASGGQLENPQSSSQESFTIGGINPILFIIPVAAGVGLLVFKKREMLEGITEKIGLGDKISEIKERVLNLKQR